MHLRVFFNSCFAKSDAFRLLLRFRKSLFVFLQAGFSAFPCCRMRFVLGSPSHDYFISV